MVKLLAHLDIIIVILHLFYNFIKTFMLSLPVFPSVVLFVAVEMMDCLLILTYCITLCLVAICDRWERATFEHSHTLLDSIFISKPMEAEE